MVSTAGTGSGFPGRQGEEGRGGEAAVKAVGTAGRAQMSADLPTIIPPQ